MMKLVKTDSVALKFVVGAMVFSVCFSVVMLTVFGLVLVGRALGIGH